MLNINRGHNEKLKEMCKSLKDYSEYTARVREYAQVKPVEEAVEQAISECIQEGILSEFLKQNRAEAKQVSIYEYDEEKHMRQEREASWEEGREVGREEGREEGRAEGREEGRADATLKDIRNIMTKLNKSADEAMDILDVPIKERETLKTQL